MGETDIEQLINKGFPYPTNDIKKYWSALANQFGFEWCHYEDKKMELKPKTSVIGEINHMVEEIKNKGFELEETYNGIDGVAYNINIPELNRIGFIRFNTKDSSKHYFITSTDLQVVYTCSVSNDSLNEMQYKLDTQFKVNKDGFQKYLEQLDYIRLLYKQSKIKIKKFSAALDFV